MLRLATMLLLAGLVAAAAAAAPPLSGRIGPLPVPKGPIGPPKVIVVDPALFDTQMLFDWRHASINPFKHPQPPNATAQGIGMKLINYDLVGLQGAKPPQAAMLFVGSNTNVPAYADFTSNAFNAGQRKALSLSWTGQFVPGRVVEMRLMTADQRVLGAVLFRKGQVIVTAKAGETVIGSYVGDTTSEPSLHRITLRADLAKHSYTVRFEQSGKVVASIELPWPVAGALPVGMQQIVARLTCPDPYALWEYDVAVLSLSGEPL